MSKKLKILFVMFISMGFLASAVLADTITVTNPSFESGSNASTGSYEYYASPDGTNYANRSASDGYTSQLTDHTITTG